jgi:hypothetical protein
MIGKMSAGVKSEHFEKNLYLLTPDVACNALELNPRFCGEMTVANHLSEDRFC